MLNNQFSFIFSKTQDFRHIKEPCSQKIKLNVGKAVLRDSKDRKVASLLNILGAAQNERDAKRKEASKARSEAYRKVNVIDFGSEFEENLY